MLPTNTVLNGRYRIISLLGRGGMGAVYEARDAGLGDSPVAIKQTLLTDEHFRVAFQREANLLAGLFHPALPRVRDQFVTADGQFLVMDLVPGDDLDSLHTKYGRAFAVDQVVAWADQLLDALEYLHTHDPPIVHRDIKPQNIKVTPKGQVVLLDFGLAKGGAGNKSSIVGSTIAFAPPEQIAGRGTGPASDLYSLAATVYTLITGQLPVDAMTRMEAKAHGRLDPLRPPCEINPHVAQPLSDLIMAVLALDAAARIQTASEMRRWLRHAFELQRGAPSRPAAPAHLPDGTLAMFAPTSSAARPPTAAQGPAADLVVDNGPGRTDPRNLGQPAYTAGVQAARPTAPPPAQPASPTAPVLAATAPAAGPATVPHAPAVGSAGAASSYRRAVLLLGGVGVLAVAAVAIIVWLAVSPAGEEPARPPRAAEPSRPAAEKPEVPAAEETEVPAAGVEERIAALEERLGGLQATMERLPSRERSSAARAADEARAKLREARGAARDVAARLCDDAEALIERLEAEAVPAAAGRPEPAKPEAEPKRPEAPRRSEGARQGPRKGGGFSRGSGY